MFPTNSERLIGISDAFPAFVYGYPSSCPRDLRTPNKSALTLRYTRRPGPIYTGHARRFLPSAVPWISEDRLLVFYSHLKTAGIFWVVQFLLFLFFNLNIFSFLFLRIGILNFIDCRFICRAQKGFSCVEIEQNIGVI